MLGCCFETPEFMLMTRHKLLLVFLLDLIFLPDLPFLFDSTLLLYFAFNDLLLVEILGQLPSLLYHDQLLQKKFACFTGWSMLQVSKL